MRLAGDLLFGGSWYAPFYSLFIIQVLLFCSHLSLLNLSIWGVVTRLALLLPTLFFTLDVSLNPRYSLGTPMRDLAWGAVGWYMIAKALDVGLVHGLEGGSPPRWCIPDWAKEAKKEDSEPEEPAFEGSNAKELPFWKRTPIPRRPKWAEESNYLPSHWRLLPLPVRLVDQMLWAFDVLLLRRPGTSLLFPDEMRALDWSQKRLQDAARYRREGEGWRAKVQLHPNVTPFGYSETSFSDAITQFVIVICAVYFIASLDVPASQLNGFYGLAMYKQLLISTSMGVLIAFPGDLPELLCFPLLQRKPFNLPCTAITPHFRNVVRSKNLTNMWGFQWHGFIKRDVMRLGMLLPVLKKNRVMMLLKSFFWSAVFHSFLFVRVRPQIDLASPLTILHGLYFPGSFALFMGQGLLVIAENVFLSLVVKTQWYKRINSSPTFATLLPYLQTCYVYGSLIWMARWLIAELVPLRLLTHQEIHAMSLSSQWADYSSFWIERWNELFV